MEKKAKKRIELMQPRLQKLRAQLAGAKKQMDEPADVPRLQREIADASDELEKLKQAP